MFILITCTTRFSGDEHVDELERLGHTVVWQPCDTFPNMRTTIQSMAPDLLIDDWKRRTLRNDGALSHSYFSANQTASQLRHIRKCFPDMPWIMVTTADGCLAYSDELQFVPLYHDDTVRENWGHVISDAVNLVSIETKLRAAE